MDLPALLEKPLLLAPQQTALIPCGFAMLINTPNIFAMITPRSGLGHKHGIVLGNTVGIIDADYAGEVKVSLLNRSNKPYTIKPFDRIAQLIILPCIQSTWQIVDGFDLENNTRGNGGFGSTGK
jgi:dUTP pyrophosphatase